MRPITVESESCTAGVIGCAVMVVVAKIATQSAQSLRSGLLLDILNIQKKSGKYARQSTERSKIVNLSSKDRKKAS
jgi:hypothetical protein